MERTQPRLRFPKDHTPDPNTLAGGRYGTLEMCDAFGPEQTFRDILHAQAQSAVTLSEVDGEIVPPEHAAKIVEMATLEHVDPDRIRELEALYRHDVVGVSRGLEEVLPEHMRQHVGKAKTSADSTQPARALQLKRGLEIIRESGENLRDIVIEKAVDWIDIVTMDQSHEIDALPASAGRVLAHYAEALHTSLCFIGDVEYHSTVGKWADATGCHHQASALGVDGMDLEARYCERLGIGHMIAPAQLPGLEFEADVSFVLWRLSSTIANLANYMRYGKGTDRGIFRDGNPKKGKGSSSMPHKDRTGGNPIVEEQEISLYNYLMGNVVTAMANGRMDYARDLSGSANARINLEDGFKVADHCIRRLAGAVYWLEIDADRCKERVERTYGVTTSNRVLAYLTDRRRTERPMSRADGDKLMGKLATEAWDSKRPFVELLLADKEVTSRLEEGVIRELANPFTYLGQSKEQVRRVEEFCHKVSTKYAA